MKQRDSRQSKIQSLDLGYLQAATILARQPEHEPITIYLVGCGGTGSYMAQSIGRLLVALNRKGTRARAVFYDHDHVEPKNIGRQLFSEAELGRNKAETLALRYGSAWGLDVTAVAERFKADLVKRRDDELVILVGCVDNAAGRKEMANACAVANKPGRAPDLWWVDCGNHEDAGQVLLGSAVGPDQMKGAFPSRDICQALPAPTVQSPELWIARPEEKAKKLSCAELLMLNQQSLNINNRIAAEASDMLTRLLLTRNLKRFACELNLAAGSMKSSYATPEEVARVLSKPVSFVHKAAA